MRKCVAAAALVLCLLLVGCGNVFDGHYTSVKPHEQQNTLSDNQNVSASNYDQLCSALETLVKSGQTEGVIGIAEYDEDRVTEDINRAITKITKENPIGAYAVKSVRFEKGTRAGKAALLVDVEYIHTRADILKILHATGMEAAGSLIRNALEQCEADLVLLIRDYEQTDFVQLVENYAFEYPQLVMEQPAVAANVYPESGDDRVVELRFTYQTSRDSLRNMRQQVKPVFESAMLYVSGDGEQREKYSQLYSFLMERYDYQIAGSITPTYSLLRHGVGDSRAFATVYGAMCRQAGLECMMVSGTRDGESWHWNIICVDGVYYHVNLLEDNFHLRKDTQMSGFVWDYSAYPACGVEPVE